MGKIPLTSGKGDKPRKVDGDKYRSHWDVIFRKPITCDICGRFVSYDDLDSGAAIRQLDTPDSDYSTETYETYHVKCKKATP